MPLKGEDISTTVAEVPVLENLVSVLGSECRPVTDVLFSGLTFSYTTWLRPSYAGHVPLQAGMYLTEAYKLRPKMERPDNHKLDNQGWLGRAGARHQHSAQHGVPCALHRHQSGLGLEPRFGVHA